MSKLNSLNTHGMSGF